MSSNLATRGAFRELAGEDIQPDREAAIARANQILYGASPEEVFDEAAAMRPYLLTSFGLQSALLIARMHHARHRFPMLFINTGAEHPETLEYMATLQSKFDLDVTVISPDPADFGRIVDKIHVDGYAAHEKEFNRLTKLDPLQKFLHEQGVSALVTGIRASQTANRAGKQLVTLGRFDELRINPHLYLSDEEARALYSEWGLPQHPLKDYHFDRLPNTLDDRPVKTECGLHLDPETEAALLNSTARN